jgi:hypothetical protein
LRLCTKAEIPGVGAGETTIEDVARELVRCSPKLRSSAERFELSQFWSEINAWPPDVFAFTSMVLGESGARRPGDVRAGQAPPVVARRCARGSRR